MKKDITSTLAIRCSAIAEDMTNPYKSQNMCSSQKSSSNIGFIQLLFYFTTLILATKFNMDPAWSLLFSPPNFKLLLAEQFDPNTTNHLETDHEFSGNQILVSSNPEILIAEAKSNPNMG